jgi:hypothetical protein
MNVNNETEERCEVWGVELSGESRLSGSRLGHESQVEAKGKVEAPAPAPAPVPSTSKSWVWPRRDLWDRRIV